MAEQFANGAQTSLSAGVNNVDGTITVVSATGFPTTGNFRILIKAEASYTDEICTVTGVSGTTFTITRASEAIRGVQAASIHNSGAEVIHVLTAGALSAIVSRPVTFSVGAGATAYIPDADIPRGGSALISDSPSGNSGSALIQWYRHGTFNSLNGVATGNHGYEFRNTTYSGGSTGFSFFIENNTAGGRLGCKNNNGIFGRDFILYIFTP